MGDLLENKMKKKTLKSSSCRGKREAPTPLRRTSGEREIEEKRKKIEDAGGKKS